MAERAMIGSERGTYNYEKALQRRRDIRGAGAEEITKYGLGDYVMLTDKTVVKSSWLDENIDAIDKSLIDTDGKSKLFSTQETPTGEVIYFIKDDNIADDLIDYDGDSTVLGKPAGQDAVRGKTGFVALMGGDAAAAKAKQLIDEANNALAPWQGAGKYMQDLAVFAITRKT